MGKMSQSRNDDGLKNAQEIIERFGGIRPMASKMDVPVTTVQGWKKRNTIPENRKEQVMNAAQSNRIDLSDILVSTDIANENLGGNQFKASMQQAQSEQTSKDIDKHERAIKAGHAIISDENSVDVNMLLKKVEAAEKLAAKNAWMSVALFVFVLAVTLFLLWPSRDNGIPVGKIQQIDKNTAQIEDMTGRLSQAEAGVDDLYDGQHFFMGLLPDNIQETVETLKKDAEKARETVSVLSQTAKNIQEGVIAQDAGGLSQRISVLEREVESLAGSNSGIASLMTRLNELQATVEGQEQLTESFSQLQALVMDFQGAGEQAESTSEPALESVLAQAATDDDSLGQTLEGVSRSNVKAAAMLLALTQFRQALHRDKEPFEEDLAVLRKLVGEDDPELALAIERLAPKAKEGVLSPGGLQEEFKGLAGDIVVSSLMGEEVSVQEKARARFNEIVQVEKDGELVTGTDTQATVARAQKMLDDGNIEQAIAELQSLDGEAAKTAQPFIQEAEYTLMAQQLESLINLDVLSELKSGGGPLIIRGQSIESITRDLKNKITSGKLVRDEKSGVSILEPGMKMPIPDEMDVKIK
jgi:hypothetical protein